jgi:hypothetical protein
MIVQRFRAIGWVAIVAAAVCALYLISLQVAVERGKLEAVEAQIGAAQREVRQLQTELGTRASLRQLERWNGDVLALTAPKATQFVNDGAQLVAVDQDAKAGVPNAPPPMMASAAVPKPVDVTVPSIPDDPFVKPVPAAKSPQIAMATPPVAKPAAKTEDRKRP